MDVAILMIGTFLVIRLIAFVVTYLINMYVGSLADHSGREKQVRDIVVLVNILLWIGMLFLIDNLGYNIITITTGLGIGGYARKPECHERTFLKVNLTDQKRIV